MTNSIAWLNGEEIAFRDMSLPVWDLGVVAGAAISEMARTYRHRPFKLTEHVDRLVNSCQELGFALPFNKAELCESAASLVERNCQRMVPAEDLGIVWFVTAGANRTYLGEGSLPGPSVGIHTFRLPFELWAAAAEHGATLQIPSIRQISTNSLPVHRKVRNRLHWWLADREADAIEAGAKALLLDDHGNLTETSTAAFYGVIDSEIVTPAHNVLDSMSRKMVQTAAAVVGIPFRAVDIPQKDISRMSQAFLSSTPSGLLPVRFVGSHRMAECSVIDPLLSWWKQQTGVNPRDQIRDVAGS